MKHPLVEDLCNACPFLVGLVDRDNVDLPTVIFGQVARLLMEGKLSTDQEDRVFGHFNSLAESGDSQVFDILGTGAIELFNDDARSQKLARTNLKGRAGIMLEDFRIYFGQPDYGAAA